VLAGRVSIVVASYNHARFLAKRLDGLQAQTYDDIEILVIDDRSTDNSLDVLRPFASQPGVSVMSRPKNGGWVVTFNQGLEASTGEFLLFANCDDDCDPRLLARLVSAMHAHPTAGIAFCRSLLIDAEGKALGTDFDLRQASFRARCATDTLITGAEMSRFLLHSCTIPNTGAALIRRECFDIVGQFTEDYKVIGDWDFFFRVAARYDVAYVAEPLNWFRQHVGTIRNTSKAGLICGEYLRLLLAQLHQVDLSWTERAMFRFRSMALWTGHLISPGMSGYRDAANHWRIVRALDPAALWFLGPALMHRVGQVLGKLVAGRRRLPGIS
jgi:glycosyltransferase involved in cell wall biosynthesis